MKGQKTGGRKAGTPNRVTKQVRDSLHELFNNNFSKIETALQALEDEPTQYLSAWSKLLPFFAPRVYSISTIDAPDWVQFLQLSQEEKQAKIIELKAQLKNE